MLKIASHFTDYITITFLSATHNLLKVTDEKSKYIDIKEWHCHANVVSEVIICFDLMIIIQIFDTFFLR